MIIKPKFRGFICTTAHPEGCKKNVGLQISYAKNSDPINGPKRVLVIGSSTGYGLASRIVSTFSSGASTIGVAFERPSSGARTATAGWYNTAAFENEAHKSGFYAKTINGDAFSNEIKEETVKLIKKDLGRVDLVVYSIASPKRTDPSTGITYSSVLKPIGDVYRNKNVDFHSFVVSDVEIEPATEEEIAHTIKVMGGEDWKLWIDYLRSSGVLEDGATTVAYSYIGPEITYPIYRNGTIGKAKEHLEQTAKLLNNELKEINGRAYVAIAKAVVTQSSSAIPVVPIYISSLFKIMKERGTHEDCVQQMYRLFKERLYSNNLELDECGRIRIDELEMVPEVQKEIEDLWDHINTENITNLTDIESFRMDFFKLFGFYFDDVDYEADIDPHVDILSLNQ